MLVNVGIKAESLVARLQFNFVSLYELIHKSRQCYLTHTREKRGKHVCYSAIFFIPISAELYLGNSFIDSKFDIPFCSVLKLALYIYEGGFSWGKRTCKFFILAI